LNWERNQTQKNKMNQEEIKDIAELDERLGKVEDRQDRLEKQFNEREDKPWLTAEDITEDSLRKYSEESDDEE
jgi:flagellar motility protein MotE (MotC chaperone)